MKRRRAGSLLGAALLAATSCHEPAPPAASPAAPEQPEPPAANPVAPIATVAAPEPPRAEAAPPVAEPAYRGGGVVACAPGNWEARPLPPLLASSKKPVRTEPDRNGSSQLLFDADCSDSPNGPSQSSASQVVVDGVAVRLTRATAAGVTGRGWTGNQCFFELSAADSSGRAVALGPDLVPPFNSITALVRSGSAVWLSVGFNGYAREFPAGGNRIIAADLCTGRVTWSSANATSNGGLLLLGDYLVSPYGFTSEPRFVYVLDTHTGAVVQKLPVVENVCPSESWRPHWHPGERCDAPGQRVGAATNPRVSGNLLFVDTNTGSATFALR